MKPKSPLIEYIHDLALLLNLGHWQIKLSTKTAPDDSVATVLVIAGQQVAEIRVQSGFMDLPPEDIRSALLHELIHVHLWPLGEVVEHAGAALGSNAASILEAAHGLANERATDALSLAIAPFFPLPA